MNIKIMIMGLDLMHVHNFHGQSIAGLKMPLFLLLASAHLCMLIIKIKISYFSVKVQNKAPVTTEAKYPIDFTQPGKKLVLSLHYNRSDSFLLANTVKMYEFKAKYSETKPYSSCLVKIQKILQLIIWKRQG